MLTWRNIILLAYYISKNLFNRPICSCHKTIINYSIVFEHIIAYFRIVKIFIYEFHDHKDFHPIFNPFNPNNLAKNLDSHKKGNNLYLLQN